MWRWAHSALTCGADRGGGATNCLHGCVYLQGYIVCVTAAVDNGDTCLPEMFFYSVSGQFFLMLTPPRMSATALKPLRVSERFAAGPGRGGSARLGSALGRRLRGLKAKSSSEAVIPV